MREGLAIVAEEGLENRWDAPSPQSQAFVAGIEAMGLAMHVTNPADRLWTLNTPRVPAGVDDAKVRAYLLESHGIEIAGGFGPLAGKVFRIGTMGYGSTPRERDADPGGSGRGAAEARLSTRGRRPFRRRKVSRRGGVARLPLGFSIF